MDLPFFAEPSDGTFSWVLSQLRARNGHRKARLKLTMSSSIEDTLYLRKKHIHMSPSYCKRAHSHSRAGHLSFIHNHG